MINVILGDEMDFAECLHKIDHPIILETINDLKDIKYRRSLNYLFVSGAEDLRKFQQKFSSKLFHNDYVSDGFCNWGVLRVVLEESDIKC